MEPRYVLILDFCVGCLNIIKLTDEELRESEEYEDFESFLSTIEEKYGFRLSNCQWMTHRTQRAQASRCCRPLNPWIPN